MRTKRGRKVNSKRHINQTRKKWNLREYDLSVFQQQEIRMRIKKIKVIFSIKLSQKCEKSMNFSVATAH